MSEWRTMTVDEIKATHKKAIISGPFGSNISSKYFVNDGIPVIRGNNLSLDIGKKFTDAGFVYITEEKANELGTWATKDDLVFTAVGTIGQVGILIGNEKYEKYIISNKQLRVTLNKDIVIPIFAYYWFASETMIEQIEQRNTGSSVPLINLSVLKSLTIPIPPLPEQKAIAAVLSSLDDKIDLLHRQNKTLEAIAETLFKQWFVVEAREGWNEITLGVCCEKITKGTTPTTLKKDFVSNGINFIKVNCIDENGSFLTDKVEFIDEETNELLSRSKLKEGDILYSIAGTIGRLIIVSKDILPANVNQALAIIRVNSEIISPIYIKFCLKDREITDTLHSKVVHAVQPNLSLGEISNTLIPLPPKELIEKFHKTVNPLELKISTNKKQIKNLETLRVNLLPKLMCGEVRVNYQEFL